MKIKLFDFNYDEVSLEHIEREVNTFCEGKNVIDIRTKYFPESAHQFSRYTITVVYEEKPEDMLRSER